MSVIFHAMNEGQFGVMDGRSISSKTVTLFVALSASFLRGKKMRHRKTEPIPHQDEEKTT